MQLTDAMEISRCVEATIDSGTILIEYATDIHEKVTGYWYDIQRAPKRIHNLLYTDIGYLAEELLELDIDVEALDWQVSSREVNFSDCTCKKCQQFARDNHLPPVNAGKLQLLWYRIAWACESLYWQIHCQYYSLRLRLNEWLLSQSEGE